MAVSYKLLIGAAVLALVVSLFYVWWSSFINTRRRKNLSDRTAQAKMAIVFLFKREKMLDATTTARELMAAEKRDREISDWAHFVTTLRPRFPRIAEQLSELRELKQLTLISSDANARIEAEWLDGLTRIQLIFATNMQTNLLPDAQSIDAAKHELNMLRLVTQHSSALAWVEDDNGRIAWANSAYLERCAPDAGAQKQRAWPPQKLFSEDNVREISKTNPTYFAIDGLDGVEQNWFDVQQTECDTGTLYSAQSVDQLVKAERSLSQFMNRITKTFADIPVGVAIFDQHKNLQMFNPALSDFTGLAIDFMAGQPSLSKFLMRLRDNEVMPKPPANYSQTAYLKELERAASSGMLEQKWVLGSETTLRVTGRPSPDGGLALVFEDITTAMSLSNQYQRKIDVSQSIIDSLPEALAVFSKDGTLLMSNTGYKMLWDIQQSNRFESVSLTQSIDIWQNKSRRRWNCDALLAQISADDPHNEITLQFELENQTKMCCQSKSTETGDVVFRFTRDKPSHGQRQVSQIERYLA